jgi:hypothetical protein
LKARRFPWILTVLLTGCSTTSCPKSAGPTQSADAGTPADAGTEIAEVPDAAPLEPAPVVEDDRTRKLLKRLDRARRGGRKTVQYREPTRVEELAHAAWVREAMAAAIEGRPPPTTAPKGFKLVDMKGLWVLRELRNTRRGAGTVVLRAGQARPILVEAPHTFFDRGTLPIALAVFEAQKARALLINTAHRNLARDAAKATADKKAQAGAVAGKHDEDEKEADGDEGDDGEADDLLDDESGDGDSDEDAKNPSPSDVAHAEHSFFLTAHKAMIGTLPGAVTVQIHGFGDDKVPNVGVVVSAAKSTADPSALAARLKRALPAHPVRVHPDEVKELGGTLNVQAHASRDVKAPFFHLELSRTLRNELAADASLRARFAVALDPIFASPAPSQP